MTSPGWTLTAFLPFPDTTCAAAGDSLTCNGTIPAGQQVTANVRLSPGAGRGSTPPQVLASTDGGATGETAQSTEPWSGRAATRPPGASGQATAAGGAPAGARPASAGPGRR